jgi:hypothetical protein
MFRRVRQHLWCHLNWCFGLLTNHHKEGRTYRIWENETEGKLGTCTLHLLQIVIGTALRSPCIT